MGRRRVHLTFHGPLAEGPAVWTMSQRFEVAFNIRRADIADGFGWMMLELVGGEERLDNALRWLEARGVVVAPIEQDLLAG